jgi:5-methylcytosine-specific restriction endonuclease McrA
MRRRVSLTSCFRIMREVLLEYAPVCHWCGCPLRLGTATLDHFIPRACGGGNRFENIVLACLGCNSRRGCRMPTVGEAWLFSRRDRSEAHAEYRRRLGEYRMAEEGALR